jgi:hypothetical protein
MAATDSQSDEAGVKGGPADPTSASRRAQWRMGRYTNALLNRRYVTQANVGWAWPKMGMEHGWTLLRVIQKASQKYPGEQCGPTRHDKRHAGTEELLSRSLPTESRCHPHVGQERACLKSQRSGESLAIC